MGGIERDRAKSERYAASESNEKTVMANEQPVHRGCPFLYEKRYQLARQGIPDENGCQQEFVDEKV